MTGACSVTGACSGAGGARRAAVGTRGQLVVAVDLLDLVVGDLGVGVDPRGVLDLLLAVRHHDVVAAHLGRRQRHEAGPCTEQAGVHGGEGRLATAVVVVEIGDLADLVAVTAVDGAALPARVVVFGHAESCSFVIDPACSRIQRMVKGGPVSAYRRRRGDGIVTGAGPRRVSVNLPSGLRRKRPLLSQCAAVMRGTPGLTTYSYNMGTRVRARRATELRSEGGVITSPDQAAGGRRGVLNRHRVVRAAIQYIDTNGLPDLTMRRLAATLGVEAMSLYKHVSGRDNLLD